MPARKRGGYPWEGKKCRLQIARERHGGCGGDSERGLRGSKMLSVGGEGAGKKKTCKRGTLASREEW